MRHFSISAVQVSDSAMAAGRYIEVCETLRNVIKQSVERAGRRGMLWGPSGSEYDEQPDLWRAGFARWRRVKKLLMQAAALSDAELLAIFLRTGLPGVHVMQLAGAVAAPFGSLTTRCRSIT